VRGSCTIIETVAGTVEHLVAEAWIPETAVSVLCCCLVHTCSSAWLKVRWHPTHWLNMLAGSRISGICKHTRSVEWAAAAPEKETAETAMQTYVAAGAALRQHGVTLK
jgi:hypothetical protein